MSMTWDQALGLFGAFTMLLAYAQANFGPKQGMPRTNALLNLIGSTALTVTAVVNQQLGFILLEGIWALISAYSLIKAL